MIALKKQARLRNILLWPWEVHHINLLSRKRTKTVCKSTMKPNGQKFRIQIHLYPICHQSTHAHALWLLEVHVISTHVTYILHNYRVVLIHKNHDIKIITKDHDKAHIKSTSSNIVLFTIYSSPTCSAISALNLTGKNK